jgi:hypothetical protein
VAKRRRARRRVRLGYSEERHLARATELVANVDNRIADVVRHLERGNCPATRVALTHANWVLGVLDGHVASIQGHPRGLAKQTTVFSDRLVHLGAQFDHVCKIG